MQYSGKIYNIPVNYSFLATLAVWLQQEFKGYTATELTIYLPSRRACRELKKILLHQSKQAALILPKIKAIGDVDYDDLWLDFADEENIDLGSLPAVDVDVSDLRLQLLMLKQLMAYPGLQQTLNNASISDTKQQQIFTEQFIGLTNALSKLFMDLAKNDTSLATLLQIIRQNDYETSLHRDVLTQFLTDFSQHWDNIKRQYHLESLMDSRNQMIRHHIKHIQQYGLHRPIILAGIDGSIASVNQLAKVLLQDPLGRVVLFGMESSLGAQIWQHIDEFHPQYLHKHLLDYLQVKPEELLDLSGLTQPKVQPLQEQLLSYALCPAQAMHLWQQFQPPTDSLTPQISLLASDNILEEQYCLVEIILQALQDQQEIAVVTNDKRTAETLYHLLLAKGLTVNNALGIAITSLPMMRLLLSLLELLDADFKLPALMAILKHPAVKCNYTADVYVQLLRQLEDLISTASQEIVDFFDLENLVKNSDQPELLALLQKIHDIVTQLGVRDCCRGSRYRESRLSLSELATAHLACLDILVNADDYQNFEAVDTIESFFQELSVAAKGIIDQFALDDYYKLLLSLTSNRYYKRDSFTTVKGIDIIAPIEGVLLDYDLVILTNMNEGEMPRLISPNPWIADSIYKQAGMISSENAIGIDAFNFYAYAAKGRLICSRSLHQNGNPTESSRFLLRWQMLLGHLGMTPQYISLPIVHYRQREERLNRDIHCSSRPLPKSPTVRIQTLSATGVEKFLANPYAIYAAKILHLSPHSSNKHSIFGSFVHKVFEQFYRQHQATEISQWNANQIVRALVALARVEFDNFYSVPVENIFQWHMFLNIAQWFAKQEIELYQQYALTKVTVEQSLSQNMNGFKLSAIVDRINYFQDGSVSIIDYKTGTVPTKTQVKEKGRLQLPLEAILLHYQSFHSFEYWKVDKKGGDQDNKIQFNSAECTQLIGDTQAMLQQIIQALNDVDFIYQYQYRANALDEYKQLGRVEEWYMEGEDD